MNAHNEQTRFDLVEALTETQLALRISCSITHDFELFSRALVNQLDVGLSSRSGRCRGSPPVRGPFLTRATAGGGALREGSAVRVE
jgi:hypothetical protein